MHIALTGASGFIGSAIARRLHAAGHTVAALVRPTSRRGHIQPYIARFVVGTHDDESIYPALLDGADCLIHNSLDWGPLHSPASYDTHAESNLLASLRLLHASAPRQFIFVSTCAVHHDIRPRWRGLIDEDHPLRPNTTYGASKAAVEAFLWAAHYRDNRHTCALRPTRVYGIDPQLDRSHGYDLILALGRREPINKPGGGKWVHVEDVAAAIAAAIGNPAAAGRPFNLSDCYARWADLAQFGAEALGIQADIDFSSPPQPQNHFAKDAARELGIALDRGHEGLRIHMRELAAAMQQAGVLP
jgi:nucleoside-diphosphate-sugar epimerase